MEYSLLARRKAICRLTFKEHCCCYIRPPMHTDTYVRTSTRCCFSNFLKVALIGYTMRTLTTEKAEGCGVHAQLLRHNADSAEVVCMSS